MFKRAFPWLEKREEPRVLGEEFIRGEKVVLREKRIQDAEDDYAWRTDEELARLDATRPLKMSFEDLAWPMDISATRILASRPMCLSTISPISDSTIIL